MEQRIITEYWWEGNDFVFLTESNEKYRCTNVHPIEMHVAGLNYSEDDTVMFGNTTSYIPQCKDYDGTPHIVEFNNNENNEKLQGAIFSQIAKVETLQQSFNAMLGYLSANVNEYQSDYDKGVYPIQDKISEIGDMQERIKQRLREIVEML